MTKPIALITFRGRCGDRNARGMAGASFVGDKLASHLSTRPLSIGAPEEPLAAGWEVELSAALPSLRDLSHAVDRILANGHTPIIAMGRCAAALASLPVVARQREDALIIWFDAHGDSNTPETSATGYLGGLVLTGASGGWTSGLGDDLNLGNVILVGARDLDPAERRLIDQGVIKLVPPGPDLAEELRQAIAGRPVYIHIDCDVLEPGLVPTEYSAVGGLTFGDLFEASRILAASEIVGIEIAEFEGETETDALDSLLAALEPIIAKAGMPSSA